MKSLCIIDPEGEECHKRLALKRQRYITSGPNILWHVDGWDKVAHLGIFIHGAIDGFSRQIIWLEGNSPSKNCSMFASHYLNTVQQQEGFFLRQFAITVAHCVIKSVPFGKKSNLSILL